MLGRILLLSLEGAESPVDLGASDITPESGAKVASVRFLSTT